MAVVIWQFEMSLNSEQRAKRFCGAWLNHLKSFLRFGFAWRGFRLNLNLARTVEGGRALSIVNDHLGTRHQVAIPF